MMKHRDVPPSIPRAEAERLRDLLCAMQDRVFEHVIRSRDDATTEDLADIVGVNDSDTIYHIDRVTEDSILEWFTSHWPGELSIVLVMEGLPDRDSVTFPPGISPDRARYVCIVDPIDGTRGLMYDKRSAWILAAVAPNTSRAATLTDIEVAVMTELPTRKQGLSDQLSAVRGQGRAGVRCERISIDRNQRSDVLLQPSRASDLHHGHVGVSRFFPAGKALLARFEEELYRRLYGAVPFDALSIFEDQYICSGGQIAELCAGRDRMIVDLRPLAHRKLGWSQATDCHPYDICTAMILTELGGVVTDPRGRVLDAPLDTTTPVAWVGYANRRIASHVQPVLAELVDEMFS